MRTDKGSSSLRDTAARYPTSLLVSSPVTPMVSRSERISSNRFGFFKNRMAASFWALVGSGAADDVSLGRYCSTRKSSLSMSSRIRDSETPNRSAHSLANQIRDREEYRSTVVSSKGTGPVTSFDALTTVFNRVSPRWMPLTWYCRMPYPAIKPCSVFW